MPVEAASAERTSTIFHVDPATIQVSPGWNCRDFDDPKNETHVKRLAESIRRKGVKEPLTVVEAGGRYVLINGESRLRAIRLLADQGHIVSTVPVQVDASDLSDGEKFAEQIIRNSGKPYTVLEQCAVFLRMRALGLDDKNIAYSAGMTLERMRQIMSLNEASPKVRKLIQSGAISATAVQRLISQGAGPESVEDRVEDAVRRARAEGKTKAGPRHLKAQQTDAGTEDGPVHPTPPSQAMIRVSAKALMAELLKYQSSAPKRQGKTVSVSFRIPEDRWERIKGAVF